MTAARFGAYASAKRSSGAERRRWERIPVAIPVFVQGVDSQGKEFREFTTAFNLSAGGLLLATRRYLPTSSRISLEIPSAPLPKMDRVPSPIRKMPGQLVTVTHNEQCYLWGVRFFHPLIRPAKKP